MKQECREVGMFDALLESLPRAMQVIENGIVRAQEQLAQAEQRLSTLTEQPNWYTFSIVEQKRLLRQANADVATGKRTLSQAQATQARLKKKMRGR